jgi:long-chain acyl-CoA synthetase
MVSDGDLSWPLARAEEMFGDREAISDGLRALTYAELARDVRALAGGLAELGVGGGERLGFLGVNSLAHVECALGVPAAGRVLVDLNFRLAEAELAYIAADCELRALVVDEHQLEVGRALRARVPGIGELIYDGPGPCPEDCVEFARLLAGEARELEPLAGDTLAVISYTGGTTGSPKGVMLSHRNLLANAAHNLIATGHTTVDRWLHVCPMFHVAGTANIFACTWVGATQFVLPRFDARRVAAALREWEITHTVLVPTMLGLLMEQVEQEAAAGGGQVEQEAATGGGWFPSLRHIQYAASPIPAALQRRVIERFGCDIVQFYGMTEAAPTVSSLTAEEHRLGLSGTAADAARLRGIGREVVGVQAEVRDLSGARCAPDEVGELWVRGPNVMLSYWNRPEATADALVDGWYRTGDAARRDAQGYLYLVDRLKDMIISGGENVYSVEVESALGEHPAVAEAAVFGVPHERWGEAVHAVVALRPGHAATPDELIEHCRSLIAGYKLPRTIEIRDEPLPKSGAGKLLKHVLREPHWQGHERRVH